MTNFKAPGLALATLLLALPLSGYAVDFIQDDWQGGAVSGSTTSVLTGHFVYDSDDGNIVIFSTGVATAQNAPRSWIQTNDGTGDGGFNRAGSVFSSAAVVGVGAGASLTMVLEETVTVKASILPEPRGDIGAGYHPIKGDIYLFGGLNGPLVNLSTNVIRYNPITDSLSFVADDLSTGNSQNPGVAYHPGEDVMVMTPGSSDVNSCDGGNAMSEYNSLDQETILAPVAFGAGFGSAVFFPGDEKIYRFGGSGGPSSCIIFSRIQRYDAVTNTAFTMSAVLSSSRSHTSAAYHPGTNKIYIFGGTDFITDLDEIVEYDPVADSTKTMTAVLPSPRRQTAAVYYPPTGNILIFGGTSSGGSFDEIVEFDPVADTATVRPIVLPSPRGGLAAAYAENTGRIYLFGSSSGTPTNFTDQILEYHAIAAGTYTSSVFDTGNPSQLDTITWSSSVPAGASLGVGFRAGNSATPDGTWSNAGAYTAVSNAGSIASFGPARYVQYAATFTTTNVSTAVVVLDLTINYTQTPASASLISSAFNTGADSTFLKQIAWQGNFPSGTTAQFQIRTASDNGSGFPASWSAWLGPTGTGDFYTSSGGSDTINTTHRDAADDRWLQYRLVFGSPGTTNAPSVATVTVTFNFLPSSPTATSLTPDSSTQLTLQWTDNASNEDEFILSSGTTSGPVNTGASITTTDKPGSGGTQSTFIAALAPNTSYFVRLRAHVLPPDNLFSSFSNELNAYTQAEVPATLAFTSVFESSFTVSWSGGANPSFTPYELSLSTDGFTTNFSTPVVFAANLTATTTGLTNLAPGTTYSLRLRARNGDGITTAFSATLTTATIPSAMAGLTGSVLGVSSLSWTWVDGGAAVRYRVFSASTGTLLAEVAAPSFTQTGLSTNTAAGIQVEPFTESASAGLSPPTTTFTAAATPGATSIPVAGLDLVFLNWTLNTNPAGTLFEVTASTDGFTTNFSTPILFGAGLTAPTTSVTGLDAGTTYFFRVRAGNGDLLATAFANTPSTQTRPSTLAAPAGTVLGVSSISWTWSATGGPTVFSYDVFRASNGALLANVASANFTDAGLSTNTAYGIRVAARNDTGIGTLSGATTMFTFAAVATGTVFTSVFTSSASLSWSANTNPTGTIFELERSTDNVLFSTIASLTTESFIAVGLTGPSTHYFRVRAFNGDAVATAYDIGVSTFVLGFPPEPPRAFAAASLGGDRIQLNWDVSPTTTVVRYNLYFDNGTGTIDYTVFLASVTGSETSLTTDVLSNGVTYKFGLRAVDDLGQEEKNTGTTASASALASLTGVRAAIISPAGGRRIAGDRLTVLAQITLGTSNEIKQVRFQYKASTASTWQDITPMTSDHPNPDPSDPYFVHWDVTALSATNFDLRAIASDLSDTADGAAPVISVVVDAVDFDLREFSITGGRIQKDQTVFNGVANTLRAADPTADLVAKIIIPLGALASATTTITVISNPANAPLSGNSARPAGITLDVSLAGGQTVLSGGNSAILVFSYSDANGDGIVDGSLVRVDALALYAYDAVSQQWRVEAASSIDRTNNTLTGSTAHFSFFGAFGPAHADLSRIRVYPNPYKPNSGNFNDGASFSPGSLNSGIIFDNLPDEATIKIYTVGAQLVREISFVDTSGRIQWDTKNKEGQDVASGGYIAVITSPGQKNAVKTLAIIR